MLLVGAELAARLSWSRPANVVCRKVQELFLGCAGLQLMLAAASSSLLPGKCSEETKSGLERLSEVTSLKSC